LALAADTRWMVPGSRCILAGRRRRLREIVERQHTFEYWHGTLDRDALLTRMLPENYPPSLAVDRLVPAGEKVWLVWMRAYTYYFPRDFRVDCVFESWRFDELIDTAPTVETSPGGCWRRASRYVLVNDRFMITENGKEMYEGRTKRDRRPVHRRPWPAVPEDDLRVALGEALRSRPTHLSCGTARDSVAREAPRRGSASELRAAPLAGAVDPRTPPAACPRPRERVSPVHVIRCSRPGSLR
jgi:hypothetical protein